MPTTSSSVHLLRQLHSIIGESLSTLEFVYSEAQLSFPSLDDPYGSNPKADFLATNDSVVAATNSVVAAAEQLIATIKLPFTSLCDSAMAFHLSGCLAFVERVHVAEILREAGLGGMHVDLIATQTGVNSRKLEHVLRLLATHHFFREVVPNVFSNNRLSSIIDSGVAYAEIRTNVLTKYLGSSGGAALVSLAGDEMFKAAAHLPDTCFDLPVEHVHGLPLGNAFSRAFRTNKSVFAWLEDPGNEDRLARIGYSFKGLSQYEDPTAVGTAYDWDSLPDGSLVVDVGGGFGYVTQYLSQRNSHLRFLIQDRPEVLKSTEKELQNQAPQALASGHIQLMAHDFMDTQPVKDASVFLIRAVCHNWTDADVVKIFTRIRAAARPDTVLIIGDHIMPYACIDESVVSNIPGAKKSLASAPLLANLGKASASAYYLDLTMQAIFDCYERSLEEFVELNRSAGWKTVSVKLSGMSRFGYVVAVPI
ncbi:S-adenosyl-L-methionine-dependent methyltransferase [Ramaria rubella]|nr:S-adenosyl-L-methionine-dependent methyltransferase [Ramaria rubella]